MSDGDVLRGGVEGLYTVHVRCDLVEVATFRVAWVEETVLLVRASNEAEAEVLGREEYATQHKFKGTRGLEMQWRLAEVIRVTCVDPDLADSGLEVYSEFLSPEEADRRAGFREDLDSDRVC